MKVKIKAEEISKGEKKLLKNFSESVEKQAKHPGKKIIDISKNDILDEVYDFFDIKGPGKLLKLVKSLVDRDIKLAISALDDDEFTGIAVSAYSKKRQMLITFEPTSDDKYIGDVVSAEKCDEHVSREDGFQKVVIKCINNRWFDADVIIED